MFISPGLHGILYENLKEQNIFVIENVELYVCEGVLNWGMPQVQQLKSGISIKSFQGFIDYDEISILDNIFCEYRSAVLWYDF